MPLGANPTGPGPASRAGLAALASSLVPGWGHLLVGRRKAGIALLVINSILVIALLLGWFWFRTEMIKAWVSPATLIVLLVVNAGLLFFRGGAAADSFFRSGSQSALDWIGLLGAAFIVVTPHLVVANLTLTQYRLIDTLFATSEPLATPTSTITTAAIRMATSTTLEGSTTSSEPATTTTSPTPRIWDGRDRLNIMLLGSDAGVGRIDTRTDTIILVSIEPVLGDVAMFSVPRNLYAAPLPEGMGLWSCNCFPDIIGHLWANGEWYPDAFPGPQEPSINALKGALNLIFGVEVHYYAKVDLKGFVGMIDALGGVTIDVPKRIVDEAYPHEDGGTEHVVFEVGEQHLDGHHALAYSRIRRHSGDFARMHRQRCVLGALADQVGVADLIFGFGDFASAVTDHVETDIPIARLGDFVELLPRIDTDHMASLRITRYNYGTTGHAGQQYYDLEQIKQDAHALMADPTQALDTLDGFGLDATCDESFD